MKHVSDIVNSCVYVLVMVVVVVGRTMYSILLSHVQS